MLIRPPGMRGAAFGAVLEGDTRTDLESREVVAAELAVSADWVYMTQIHSDTVHQAALPGLVGVGDAVLTTISDLPLAVATADCVPLVLESDNAVAVVHAGWRGVVAGVLPAAIEAVESADGPVRRAALGPSIGSCCYEVGPEVVAQFDGFVRTTSWGAPSVDLIACLQADLEGIEVWTSSTCTFESLDYASYRRNGTARRQVTVGWLPSN